MRTAARRLRLQLARDAKPTVATAALALAGFAAAIVLFTALEIRLPWQERYVTRIAVRDAAGVVPHSAVVRISGVPVGRVTAVGIEGRRPVLTIEMDDGRGPLYRDARAQIRPGTPLNDRYLDVIDRGTPRAGELGRDDILPASRTTAPVDMSQVLNVFDARVRPRMRALIVELGAALDDHGDDFRRALVELSPFLKAARRMSDEVAARDVQMRRLIHNFDIVSGEVARRDRQLSRLVGSAATTFEELGDRSSALSQLFVEFPATLRDVPPTFAALRDAADHLDPALQALRPTVRSMPRGLRALERIAPDLEAGTRQLDRAVPPLTRLLRSTRPVSDELGSAFGDLTPQVRRADSMAERTAPCEKTLAGYFQYWLSVYKIFDDISVLTHGNSNYSSSSAAGTPDPALSAAKSCTGTPVPPR
jgi:virulence factor Mce-like protein